MRTRVRTRPRRTRFRSVAGLDVALDQARGLAVAGVVVYSFPDLAVMERRSATAPLTFPYIPGLLTFREGPALMAALALLDTLPDALLFDGHGTAHPRRLGLASHIGVLLDRCTVGCAKSRLVGTHDEPADPAGSWTELRDGEEIIGAVLRTRTAVRPIYVSSGHRIDLGSAIDLALACCDGLRIPKPTREADRYVAAVKRGDAR